MADSKKGAKVPPKAAPVLADHKKVGKRFIPPMAQLGLTDVRWVEAMLPEFVWIALLHDSLGFARGVEVAKQVNDAAGAIDTSLRWSAAISSFERIPEGQRGAFGQALVDRQVADELSLALGAPSRALPLPPSCLRL